MKILVTGGSGFIGTELVKSLLSKGHEVTVADLREPQIEGSLYSYCDILDPFQVVELVKDKDLIYHLAANPDPGLAEKNPRWDLRINVEGTLNVIQSCERFKTRMVFSSSAAVIYSPLSCYSISKRTCENYILHETNKKGLDARIVRFWNVYGPSQKLGFVIPDFFEKFLEMSKKMIIKGDGSDMRDYIYIEDAVEALQIVGEKGSSGLIYEIGTGKQITTYQLALLIRDVLKIDKPIETSKSRQEPEPNSENLDPINKLGWNAKIMLEEGLKRVGENKW